MKKVRTEMTISSLPVAVFKEGRTYVAYTPLLDLSAQGSSLKEVQKNFDEVFDLYVEETVKNGTLMQDLRKHGWKAASNHRMLNPPELSPLPVGHTGKMELKAFTFRTFPSSVYA